VSVTSAAELAAPVAFARWFVREHCPHRNGVARLVGHILDEQLTLQEKRQLIAGPPLAGDRLALELYNAVGVRDGHSTTRIRVKLSELRGSGRYHFLAAP